METTGVVCGQREQRSESRRVDAAHRDTDILYFQEESSRKASDRVKRILYILHTIYY